MSSKFDTIVQFSGLKPGRYAYQYHVDDEFFQSFENEDLTSGSVDFEVSMERKERLLVFSFSFHGIISTVCDRCLEPLQLPIVGSDSLTVRILSEKFEGIRETDDESVVELSDSEYQLDLAQWLYEFVVIHIPIQRFHPDDDEGNSTCNPAMLDYMNNSGRQDDNEDKIDPRWAKLLDLNNEKNNKK